MNVGGHLTKNFPLERGVPQGNPISAYLFILAIELLNIALLNNRKIGKVWLTDKVCIDTEIYADDLSMVLPNSIVSIEAAIETIKRFEDYSGLAINLDKSTLSIIGHNHNMKEPQISDKTIKWTKTFKILGINYTTCLTQDDCCMSPGRAKFLKQLLPFLSQNFIDSGIEIGHKKLRKKISWVEKR